MSINQVMQSKTLRQGEKTSQVISITNTSDQQAKSAIEVTNIQPQDSPLMQKFTVQIVTQDELQTPVYAPTPFADLASHGFTILETLEPHVQKNYEITFAPVEDVGDDLQDTSFTFDITFGTEGVEISQAPILSTASTSAATNKIIRTHLYVSPSATPQVLGAARSSAYPEQTSQLSAKSHTNPAFLFFIIPTIVSLLLLIVVLFSIHHQSKAE